MSREDKTHVQRKSTFRFHDKLISIILGAGQLFDNGLYIVKIETNAYTLTQSRDASYFIVGLSSLFLSITIKVYKFR